MILIKNARVMDPESGFDQVTDILLDGKRIRQIGKVDDVSGIEQVIDASGMIAAPGLIDVHFHGCMGYDFCDGTKEAIEKIAEYEASQGVTTIVPATMTLSEEELMKIMANGGSYENKEGSAVLAGINMEGPFICSKKKGAQAATHIHKPDVTMFRRLQDAANGLIRLVDIAPEEEGAMEFISELKDEVHISFAHTTAAFIFKILLFDLLLIFSYSWFFAIVSFNCL